MPACNFPDDTSAYIAAESVAINSSKNTANWVSLFDRKLLPAGTLTGGTVGESQKGQHVLSINLWDDNWEELIADSKHKKLTITIMELPRKVKLLYRTMEKMSGLGTL